MAQREGGSGSLNLKLMKQASGGEKAAGGVKGVASRAGKGVVAALMTVEDAATRLALSPSMVRKMIGAKQLTPVRIGRSVRLRVDDIEAIVVAGGQ